MTAQTGKAPAVAAEALQNRLDTRGGAVSNGQYSTTALDRKMRREALRYASDLGWAVLPVDGKEPATPHGFYDASDNLEVLGELFDEAARITGVGLRLGGPKRLIAPEFDRRHGGTEQAFAQHVGAWPGDVRTPTYRTSDGLRMIFTAPPSLDLEFGSVTLAPGIDVFGHQHQVVLPPSVHPSGVLYEWLDGLAPWEVDEAPMPDVLVQRLQNRPRPTTNGTDPKKHASGLVDHDVVKAALAKIPPWGISYDEWVSVLMAVHSALPSADGLAIAEAWAEGKPGEVGKKWRGFKDAGNLTGKVTLGTLYKFAKDHGWEGPPRPKMDLLTLGINDEANAEALTLLHPGKFAYTATHGWLQFDGVFWDTDTAEPTVERAIVHTLGERIKAALASDAEAHEKLIKFCAPNASRMRGAKDMLSSKVAVSHKLFDASPDLLNCPNCVVDLRSGAMIPHRSDLYFMHVAGVDYDPSADWTGWHNWIVDTVGGDATTAAWVQMAVGYTLTGRTSEEVLFYLFGPPRSGKGVFTETLRLVLGDQLARAIPFATLTASVDVDAQNFALAPLKPTRLVLASESNQYERLNEAKLKACTGGDAISVAFKHRDSFNFRPQFKIWLASNQPVNADPDDDAVWSRIRVIAFPNSHLGHEDKGLKDRMRRPANLRAVLAWAVAGAVKWYALGPDGLPELQHLAVVKDAQRAEVDHVQQWLDDCCKTGGDLFTPTRDLYANYREWCGDNGVTAKQMRAFSLSLKAKAFEGDLRRVPGKTTPARGFVGLAVL